MLKSILMASGAVAMALAGMGAPGVMAADKHVELKLSHWVPPRHPISIGYEDWAKEIEAKSGGSMTVKIFPASQLGSGADHYDMVKRGVADIGMINPGYTPGRFPVFDAINLPFMVGDSYKGAAAMARFYKKYGEKEMSDHIVCHVYSHEPGTFHLTKKEVHVPSDLKGLKIRTANHIMATFVTSLGGNSVQVPIMEAKDTLAKGITDGITAPREEVLGVFRMGDATKYTIDHTFYVVGFTEGISKVTYGKLSDAQKKVLDDTCTPEWSTRVYKPWSDDARADLKESHTVDDQIWIELTDAEKAQWLEAAKPTYAAWGEAVKKAGYDPDAVLADFKKELEAEGASF